MAEERYIFVGFVMNDFMNTAILGYEGEEVLRDSTYNRGTNVFVIFDSFKATDGNNFTNFQFIGWRLAKA